MKCEIHKLNSLTKYKYVVTFAKYQEQWVFCKHKQRDTWEVPGGHIEKGETPLEASRRELFEESGALESKITAICDIWTGDDTSGANGVVFFAEIKRLGDLPESEMEKISFFDWLPESLTYPDIYKKLFKKINDAVNKM